MLFVTVMVWWVVLCQKVDLDVKIKRMMIGLDRYGGVEESENYLEFEEGAVSCEERFRCDGDGDDVELC